MRPEEGKEERKRQVVLKDERKKGRTGVGRRKGASRKTVRGRGGNKTK